MHTPASGSSFLDAGDDRPAGKMWRFVARDIAAVVEGEMTRDATTRSRLPIVADGWGDGARERIGEWEMTAQDYPLMDVYAPTLHQAAPLVLNRLRLAYPTHRWQLTNVGVLGERVAFYALTSERWV